ncbi:MAG: transposase [Gammaproteobacteria bacterium]|nr:transposase [Gammaproteobacteria bacterium]MDJ0892908.1 transposase [Gammaproteobacteria bacterium]
MPRKPRFYLPGLPAHVVQRGNNRQAVFFDDGDYAAYLRWLEEGAQRYGCAIHAYVLMTNHVHLLVTPETREAISRMLQYLGRHYVIYVNRAYGRSGTLWEGRHKGSVVSGDDYLLRCYRYVELNPVRAGMVSSPGQYPWSSYRANAAGTTDPLLTPHERYLALGRSDERRRSAYRDLCRHRLDEEQVRDIRAAWQTGTPLGNDRFRSQLERTLKQKVGQARRGRPVMKKSRTSAN